MTTTRPPAPRPRTATSSPPARRTAVATLCAAACCAAVVPSLARAATPVGASPPAAWPDTRPVPRRAQVPALPRHWQHGAFMEVFVRAYADSDGDGIGDLRGLTARLDHLKDLGVTGLWLMPITASADHDHGYATTDHRAVEPAYGTLADVDELLRQARRRGIGVIVDYVVNHAAADHPFFAAARSDPASRWRDWFVWSDDAPQGWDIWGKNPWYHVGAAPWHYRGDVKALPAAAPGARGFYFGTFGPHMPDFNLRRPAVVDYHLDSLRFWLNRGIGGFRLDAVPHMIENGPSAWNDQPESRRLALRLQQAVRRYPGRFVVCEATAEPRAYGDPAVCGGAFAFGYVQHVVGAALGRAESVRELAAYYRSAPPTMATFVSNHDLFAGRRLWDQVGGDEARYKLAAAGYLLQPGTPYIYYGEEVGQAGLPDLPGDQPLRGPMSWTPDPAGSGFGRGTPFRPMAPNIARNNVVSQRADPASILNFYKAMLALRNGRPSIARGSFDASFADDLVLGYERRLGGERTLVLFNHGSTPAGAGVDGLPAHARLRSAWPRDGGTVAADAAGHARIVLRPLSLRVFDVTAPQRAR